MTHNTNIESKAESFVLKYSDNLLHVAEADLRASGILYEAQCFPQAYFSFQQAVEKMIKALGLTLDILTVEELIGIGHDQFKIYRKFIKQFETKIESHLKVMEHYDAAKNHPVHQSFQFEKIPDDMDKARRFFDSLKNIDLVNIDEETVDFCINEVSNMEKQERHLDILRHEVEITDRMTQLGDWIGSLGTPEAIGIKEELILFLSDKLKRDDYYKTVNNHMWVIVDYTYIQAALYFFSLLTIQHSSRTRYLSDDGTSPLTLYTKEMPVINRLPRMLELMGEAIERFKSICTQYRS